MRTASLAAFALAITSTATASESVEQPPTFRVEAVYTAEGWNLTSDAVRSHSAYLDNLDVQASLDGEALFGVPGLQLFAYAIYDNGHALNEGVVDALQGVSNIEATRAVRMYEAWAEWQLGARASLRAGLYDLNSEFDSIESAALFIHPSHGMGPDFSQSGLNGPSIFPVTSVGARARVELADWDVQFAVLDAVPGDIARPERTTVRWDSSEGLLYVGEINYRAANGARVGAGYWRYSEAFDTLTPASAEESSIAQTRNDGSYVIAETASVTAPRGGVRAFTRFGWANDDVNPIARYVGAGAIWTGFARAADEIGLAIAQARVGEPWRIAQRADELATEHTETTVELTARLPLGEHVVVQPDVQYIRQPGAGSDRDSIWAFGLRIELGLALER